MQEEALLFEDVDVVCFGEFSAAVTKGNFIKLLWPFFFVVFIVTGNGKM